MPIPVDGKCEAPPWFPIQKMNLKLIIFHLARIFNLMHSSQACFLDCAVVALLSTDPSSYPPTLFILNQIKNMMFHHSHHYRCYHLISSKQVFLQYTTTHVCAVTSISQKYLCVQGESNSCPCIWIIVWYQWCGYQSYITEGSCSLATLHIDSARCMYFIKSVSLTPLANLILGPFESRLPQPWMAFLHRMSELCTGWCIPDWIAV